MKKTITLFLAGILAVAVQAEEYTLDYAIETALRNNDEISKINKNIEISELNYDKAKKYRLPKLSYSGSLTKLSYKTQIFKGLQLLPYELEDSDLEYSNALVLTEPIYTGGAITSGIEIQKLSKNINEIGLDQKKREIKLKVSEDFLQILKLKKTKQVCEDSLKELNKIYVDLENKVNVGLVQKKPLLDIKYRISDLKASIISIENAIKLLKLDLKVVMKTDDEIIIRSMDIPSVNLKKISLEADIEYALQNKDTIKTLELSKKISEANKKIQKSELLPKVYFNYGYELYGQDYGYDTNDKWKASLVVSMDLFDFGIARDGIKAAEKEIKINEINEDIAKDKIKLAINSAYYAIEKNNDIIDVKKDSLVSAKENYRIEKDKFDLLLNTSTDLLGAETDLRKTEIELINSKIDCYITYLEYTDMVEREEL